MNYSSKDFNDIIGILPDTARQSINNFEYLRGLLDSYYNQECRYYHNYDHIYDMLLGYQKYKLEMKEKSNIIFERELCIAILFHDVIYDISSKNGENERRSSEFLLRFGRHCFPDNLRWDRVVDYILATTHSRDLSLDEPEQQLIADLDLMTFSLKHSSDFYKISDKIITEYNKFIVEYKLLYSEGDVRKGRIKFLKEFKNNIPFYYNTDCSLFDSKLAKKNIENDINRLKKL